MEAPSTVSVILTEAFFLLLTLLLLLFLLSQALEVHCYISQEFHKFPSQFYFPYIPQILLCYVVSSLFNPRNIKVPPDFFCDLLLFNKSSFQSPCLYSSFSFSRCLFLPLSHCYLFLCIYMAEHLFSHKWKKLCHFCKMNGGRHIKINKPTMVS